MSVALESYLCGILSVLVLYELYEISSVKCHIWCNGAIISFQMFIILNMSECHLKKPV